MSLSIDGNEIRLSGFVGGDPDGDDWWSYDGFSASHVITALAEVGRDTDVVIRLNSGGGIATEGAAIHAALASHKGNVHVVVEGVAASAASLLAMAGDRISMSAGAIMMVHDPAGITFGDVAAHEATIRALNTLGNSYAGVYADRSGKTVEEARELMKAETWMTGPDAVAAGFADDLGEANDNAPEPVAFAYGIYAKAPERLVALANARGWKPRAHMAAPAAPHRQRKDATMTTETPADTVPTNEPENKPTATTEQAPPTPAADPVANAAEIAAICGAFGMSADGIAAFIKGGGTVEKAKARAAEAGEIRAAVDLARRVQPGIEAKAADAFIAQGKTILEVRSALLDKIVAAQSPEVSPQAPAAGDTNTASANWDMIVAQENERQKKLAAGRR